MEAFENNPARIDNKPACHPEETGCKVQSYVCISKECKISNTLLGEILSLVSYHIAI